MIAELIYMKSNFSSHIWHMAIAVFRWDAFHNISDPIHPLSLSLCYIFLITRYTHFSEYAIQ